MTVGTNYSVSVVNFAPPPDGQIDMTSTGSGGFALTVTRSSNHQEAQIYNAAGVSTGNFIGGAATGTNGSIAQFANGNFIIASQDSNSIVYTILNASGAVIGSTTDIGAFSMLGDVDPDVVTLDNGGWAIAETAQFNSGLDGDLKLGFYSSSGVRTNGVLSSSSTLNDTGASLAKLNNGNVVIAWTRAPVGGGDSEVWFEIFDQTGGVVKAETLADTTGTINRNVKAIALDDGGFALAYEDNEDNPSNTAIALFRFSASGSPSTRLVVTPTNVSSAHPQLTKLSNGMIVVGVEDDGFAFTRDLTYLVSAAGSTLVSNGPLQFVTSGAPDTDDITDISLAGFGLGRMVVAHRDNTAGTMKGEYDQVVRTSQGDGADDVINGDDFVDVMNGGLGDDVLNGNRNNDTFNGGGGWDNAIFSRVTAGGTVGSARTEFVIGPSTVTDAVFGQFGLGVDTVNGIEAYTFDDSVNRLNTGDLDNDFRSDLIYRVGASLVFNVASSGGSSGSSFSMSDDTALQYFGTGDINRNGTADLVGRNRSTGVIKEIFTDGFSAPTPVILGTVGLDWRVQGIADVTGEGTADLVWRNTAGQVTVWGLNSSGALTAAVNVSPTIANEWQLLATNDLNDDGKADFIWRKADGTLVAWLMNGGGVAATGTIGSVGNQWRMEGAIDFTGDRKADLLFRNTATNELVIWKMDGTALVGSSSLGVLAQTSNIMGLGDWNGDGRGDIMFQDVLSKAFRYLVLDPTSSSIASTKTWGNLSADVLRQGTSAATSFFDFTAPTLWQRFNEAGSNRTTRFGSVDATATSDIIWRDSTGQVYTWSLAAGGAFASSKVVGSADQNWQIAGIGDFNGDGRSDILFRNLVTSQTAIWFLNNGGLGSSASLSVTPNLSRRVDAIGDVDNDGRDDVIWRDENGAVRVTLLNGAGVISDTAISSVAQDWQTVGTANVDGSAGKEIIFRNVDGRIAFWRTNGVSLVASGQIGSGVTPDWNIVGLGDTNADGIDDFIWRNAGTGQVSVWLMGAGGTISSFSSPGSLGNEWQVQATGDFSGDGKTDILWRNASGATATWFLNGTGFVGGSTPGTVGLQFQTAGKSPLFGVG